MDILNKKKREHELIDIRDKHTQQKNGEQASLSSGNMRRIEIVNLTIVHIWQSKEKRWKAAAKLRCNFKNGIELHTHEPSKKE